MARSVRYKNRYFWAVVACSAVFACKPGAVDPKADDPLLATVFHKQLRVSDLENIIPESASPTDSAAMANAHIEQWVRESLIMHEAEKNIPKDLNIDQLVRDYRSSLIRHQFEKQVVEQEIDTTVSATEVQAYYESNKGHFLLKEPIWRCQFAKIDQQVPRIDRFFESWKRNRSEEIRAFCEKYAIHAQLDDVTWYEFSEITAHFPANLFTESAIRRKKVLQANDAGYEYFLKVIEFKDKNDIPPLSYVREQIIKVILHHRKVGILENLGERLYEQETKNKNVKLYIE